MKKQALLAGLLLAAAVRPQSAHAANITVDGTTCTLASAIIAATTDAASGGCPAGSGADTITLQVDVTLAAALPTISSAITIEGSGHFISGNTSYKGLNVGSAGNLTANNVTIKDARTSTPGAGINNAGTVTLTNCTVSGNTSTGNSGGGILNSGTGTVTLTNCTVSGNTSSGGGGIYNLGTMTLTNSTVSGNTASMASNGGGIVNSGTVTLTNSTVSGNTSGTGGGGILITSGTATLTNCTVSGNTSGSGGGIYSFTGTVMLRSSIISGNAAGSGKEVYRASGTVTAGSYNIFGHSGETNAQAFVAFTPSGSDVTATSDGTQPTALSAILSPLANNGGPTQTHALVPGSLAIDLDTTCNGGTITNDQRGYTRPIGSGCDAGAFEFGGVPTGVDDIDDDFVFDLYDNCPYIYNPEQEDIDNDGVGDVCDNCPQLANCDQKDIDHDKIGDACDQSVPTSSGSKNLLPVYKLLLLK